MANMSYCRMYNTAQDLQDCYANWNESDSEMELEARDKILKLCRKIIGTYDKEGDYVPYQYTGDSQ